MSVPPPTGSSSLRTHKRQLAWQIILPVALAAVLGIVAGVFTLRAGAGADRLWADVALIWLLAPLLLLALLLAAVLGLMIYALSRLGRIAPEYTSRGQDLAGRLAAGVKQAADAAVKPILWINQAAAVVARFLSMFADKEE